jgi:hypothetical protein
MRTSGRGGQSVVDTNSSNDGNMKPERKENHHCRVAFRTKTGVRIRFGGYGLVARMRREGRLVRAWSTSTGKEIA